MKRIGLVICLCCTVVACGNSDDNNTTANNTTANNTTANNTTVNNTTANNTTANNTTASVSFADDVVPIISSSCAVGGCHLDPGNGTSFVVSAPAGAAEIEAALDGVSTGGGRALVAGGDLANSELYLRITGDGVPRMPFGGQLSPPQIDTITAWIEGGASFD